LPKTRVFSVLVNPAAAQAQEQLDDAEETARSMGFEIRVLNARGEAEFEPALTVLAGLRDGALLVSSDPLFVARRETLVALVNEHALPAIYGRRDFAAAGGLVSYGANLAEPYRLMGTYVGRILKGEKPADLPVAQPTPGDQSQDREGARHHRAAVDPRQRRRGDRMRRRSLPSGAAYLADADLGGSRCGGAHRGLCRMDTAGAASRSLGSVGASLEH